MNERPIEDLPPYDRRGFFRAGLARLVGAVSELVEQRLPFALPQFPPVLRPPGALPEDRFLDTCFRCGNCSDACPAQAISLRISDDAAQKGTPYIDPNRSACVICDELACMKACPSGALKLIDRLAIRIGLARWNASQCLRTQGEDCTICIDKCPLGSTAIRLEDGRVQVVAPLDTDAAPGAGCVGCGVCQLYCPTSPKAIIVEPI